MQNFISLTLLLVLLYGSSRSQTLSKETVIIETPYGKMKLKLFEETPLHKANFLKLVRENVLDSLLFHRVINNFMIQGGDPLSKKARPGDSLGHGDLGYMVPAEFNRKLIHKKGRLCAAREGDDINPKRASSASQFYLVMGKKRTLEDLKKYETRINNNNFLLAKKEFLKTKKGKKLFEKEQKYSAQKDSINSSLIRQKIETNVKKKTDKELYKFDQQQIDTYLSVGGTPHLDGSYTVFGEVIEGLEIIDKIAMVKTDKRDRPVEDVRMRIYVE